MTIEPKMNIEPVTLSGHIVRLEPMTVDHVPELARASLEPELWRLQPRPIDTGKRNEMGKEKAGADRGRAFLKPHPASCTEREFISVDA